MIESAVLENYAPMIVPLTFIYGIRSLIQSIPLGRVELAGIVFVMISLLVYYDRAAQTYNRNGFIVGLVLFVLLYMNTRVLGPVLLLCLMLASLVLIGRGVLTQVDFSTHAQYVYISLLLLFIGFVFTLIENNSLPPYPIALIVNAIGISILTLVTVSLPKA